MKANQFTSYQSNISISHEIKKKNREYRIYNNAIK